MTDFIINTPNHKRYMLPDGKHAYNMFMFGNEVHVSVIDHRTGYVKQSAYIKMKNDWEYLVELSQKLAAKRYPKELRHRSNGG